LTEKDKELEECHQRVDQAQDRLNKQDEKLKELLAERIIEKERLQKTIDRLKQENASFEQTMGTLRQENNSLEQRLNELEVNNSKNMTSVKTKSRIPVLTTSLSSSTRNSNDIISDDMSQRMKKDILLYQEKLAELTAQNKELLIAFERSKEYSELLKTYLEESRHESDERYKEILRYREEINQLKRAQIYL
jgi:chromosome segregation ATPase